MARDDEDLAAQIAAQLVRIAFNSVELYIGKPIVAKLVQSTCLHCLRKT